MVLAPTPGLKQQRPVSQWTGARRLSAYADVLELSACPPFFSRPPLLPLSLSDCKKAMEEGEAEILKTLE